VFLPSKILLLLGPALIKFIWLAGGGTRYVQSNADCRAPCVALTLITVCTTTDVFTCPDVTIFAIAAIRTTTGLVCDITDIVMKRMPRGFDLPALQEALEQGS